MLCLSVLLAVVDNTVVNVALPTISRDLSASTEALHWVVDGYAFVFVGLLLVGGNLGDRLGRRRFLQAGLALFAVLPSPAASSRSGECQQRHRAVPPASASPLPANAEGVRQAAWTTGGARTN